MNQNPRDITISELYFKTSIIEFLPTCIKKMLQKDYSSRKKPNKLTPVSFWWTDHARNEPEKLTPKEKCGHLHAKAIEKSNFLKKTTENSSLTLSGGPGV